MTSECPSCGSECRPGAVECERCGRRLAWAGSPAAPARPAEGGTLFGEEASAAGPAPAWAPRSTIADRYDEERLDDARRAATSTLVAGIAGIVVAIFAIAVFAVPSPPEPDPMSKDYTVQYAQWVSGNTFRFAARSVALLAAVALAAFALVRGMTASATLREFGDHEPLPRAKAAITLGAIDLAALLIAIFLLRPF